MALLGLEGEVGLEEVSAWVSHFIQCATADGETTLASIELATQETGLDHKFVFCGELGVVCGLYAHPSM